MPRGVVPHSRWFRFPFRWFAFGVGFGGSAFAAVSPPSLWCAFGVCLLLVVLPSRRFRLPFLLVRAHFLSCLLREFYSGGPPFFLIGAARFFLAERTFLNLRRVTERADPPKKVTAPPVKFLPTPHPGLSDIQHTTHRSTMFACWMSDNPGWGLTDYQEEEERRRRRRRRRSGVI